MSSSDGARFESIGYTDDTADEDGGVVYTSVEGADFDEGGRRGPSQTSGSSLRSVASASNEGKARSMGGVGSARGTGLDRQNTLYEDMDSLDCAQILSQNRSLPEENTVLAEDHVTHAVSRGRDPLSISSNQWDGPTQSSSGKRTNAGEGGFLSGVSSFLFGSRGRDTTKSRDKYDGESDEWSSPRSPTVRDRSNSANSVGGGDRRPSSLVDLPHSFVSMLTSPLQKGSSVAQNRRDLLMEYGTAEGGKSGARVLIRVRSASDESEKPEKERIEFLVKDVETGEERLLTEQEARRLTSSSTLQGFRKRRSSISTKDETSHAATIGTFSPANLLAFASGKSMRRAAAQKQQGSGSSRSPVADSARDAEQANDNDERSSLERLEEVNRLIERVENHNLEHLESSDTSDTEAAIGSAVQKAPESLNKPRGQLLPISFPAKTFALPKREHQRALREFRVAQGFVRTAAPNKWHGYRLFENMCRVQYFSFHEGPIWSLEFSHDGKYLASGGQDTVVLVWDIQNHESSHAAKTQEVADLVERLRQPETAGGGLIDPYIFQPTLSSSSSDTNTFTRNKSVRHVYRRSVLRSENPHRVFRGHKGDVLCVAWSPNNFLLSSSMDKTVRLWHVDYGQVLRKFLHADFVTSVAFHPKNENFFLSGSLDERVRLWNISMRHVSDFAEVRGLITACGFTPNGEQALVGTYKGECKLYNIVRFEEGERALQYITTLDVRSRRGKNSRGSKITSFAMMPALKKPGTSTHQKRASQLTQNAQRQQQQYEVLISTNDSRLRLYRVQDLRIVSKYAGHSCTWNHIRASFSDDYRFVITASEDRQVYIWQTVLYDDVASSHQKGSESTSLSALLHSSPAERNAPKAGSQHRDRDNETSGTSGSDNGTRPAGARAIPSSRPRIRRYRNEEYECFMPNRDARVTAAAFGPRSSTLRDGLEPSRLRHRWAEGRVVVTASHDGCISVFENIPAYLLPF